MTRAPRREVTVDERTSEKTSKTSEKGVSYTSEGEDARRPRGEGCGRYATLKV